uniref:E3 ubiquitin-protein ligase RNF123 n=1 Tax=Cacopsylla melanoneura TaxID=428564 RepID=A0A8D9DZA1_9HEMI
MQIQKIVEQVFGQFGNHFLTDLKSDVQAKHPDETIGDEWNYTIEDVKFTVDRILNLTNPKQSNHEGRIGPPETVFDSETKNKSVAFSSDKLTATCTIAKGSGTARANTALYKGKWQYEIQLGTCGIMQIGWCTVLCKFIGEMGVGDTTHSYAYDGQRNKKWNVAAQNYGETWFAGDIIGTAIDLDAGTIEFYRNGFSMGIAFEKIQTGPGMAYFPAISLSSMESVVANFGGSPFKYPLAGYEPIQAAPLKETIKANILLDWMANLLSLEEIKCEFQFSMGEKVSEKALICLFASLLFRLLSPLLNSTYIIEACLLPFVKRLLFAKDKHRKCASIKYDVPSVSLFLDYAWMFLEVDEISQVLDVVCQCLDSTYRRITYNVDYPHQRETLCVLHALIKHSRTRRHLTSRVFFHTIMIHNFLHIKPLDYKSLSKLVPVVCWEYGTDREEHGCEGEDAKEKYAASIKTILDSVTELEQMHLSLLRVLFTNTDGTATQESSRKIFLRQLRDFLVQIANSRHKSPKILGPTLLSNFYQLVSLFQSLWEEELSSSQPVLVPGVSFTDPGFRLVDTSRLGGSFWSLVHTDWTALNNMSTSTSIQSESTVEPTVVTLVREVNQELNYHHPQMDMLLRPGNMESQESLIELFNSIVLMYNAGVHKQLVKVASIKSKMREYTSCYIEYKNKLNQIDDPVTVELNKYFEVCRTNIDIQGRHVAWILSAIYSTGKQLQLAWILRTVLRTLEGASKGEDRRLLSFVPCFYVDTLVCLTSVLRTHFDPLVPIRNIPDYLSLLQSVAEFLSSHIPDPRITDKGVKDTLRESAAGFFCSPLTLKCMEEVTSESMTSFIRALLRAYSGSNWAQTNWILVRIWHGSGFAFRYTQSPHLSKFAPDLVLTEPNLLCQRNTPCPSAVYQENIQRLLLQESNVESSSAFLNSLLNQLNWAFSEFISMIQGIQNLSTERVVLQTRHLVITATCFEILVCLLRVLEMVVVLARPLFTDPARPNSTSMLERLCQILCQLLLRCSSSDGCFNFIINLVTKVPEILSIDHFPILSATAGILVSLLGDELDPDPECTSIPPVTRALLSENFPLHSIKFMLNQNETEDIDMTSSSKTKKPFSFESYSTEVSSEEIVSIRRVIASFQVYQKRLSIASEMNDDDNKCAICYNYENSVKFEPCGHESCKSCINHHLLNTRRCFFCKTPISKVIHVQTDTIVHDLTTAATGST